MDKKELETRNYDVTFDESSEDGVVDGRPIVYNSRTNLGPFDEVIEPGALDGADMTDVRLCLNHDTSYVYARSRRNNPNSTMQISVDAGGMNFRARLAVNESTRARDLYSAIKRADIDKMSFMFSINEDRWENLDSEHPTRHITKIGSVVEISAVTFPAYDSTEINARSVEALENARLSLEKEKEQRAKSVDTLALEKAKFEFYSKF